MKQTLIGLDVDDLVANLVDPWLHLSNCEYGENITQKDIKSWAISEYVKCGQDIYKYLKDPTLYDIVEPVEGAKWGIECLRAIGFNIVFITAATPEQSGRKYEWLCDYEMIKHRKEYVEALDKSLIKTDYLIDDNPEHVINASGQGIVFTKEWNKTLTGYPRMNSWQDIVEYFVIVEDQIDIIGV